MKSELLALFPKNYITSRQRFRGQLARVQERWPNAELSCHALTKHPDLTIDWLRSEALEQPEKLFMLTTGEHGAEGIVGSAMMQLFIEEYLSRLNPQDTGLLLVHAINPWGMQHNRRVNPNNVDLNRNFIGDGKTFSPAANPNYRSLNAFLNPQDPLRVGLLSTLKFTSQLMRMLLSPGEATLRAGMLNGQYEFPQGVYFGGQQVEEETGVIMGLCRDAIAKYARIVHLDMHTGYGPRYQMSLVNSPLEPRPSEALARAFDYPEVVAATPNEFYSIQGDMMDWVYQFVQSEFPEKSLYAAAFEFGTLGNSLLAGVRSMQAIIRENQFHWCGAINDAAAQHAKIEFSALFSPTEMAWREKAVADACQAFEGVLQDQGFFGGQNP